MSDELAELFNLEVDEFNKKPKVCLSPNLPPTFSLSAHSLLICGRCQSECVPVSHTEIILK